MGMQYAVGFPFIVNILHSFELFCFGSVKVLQVDLSAVGLMLLGHWQSADLRSQIPQMLSLFLLHALEHLVRIIVSYSVFFVWRLEAAESVNVAVNLSFRNGPHLHEHSLLLNLDHSSFSLVLQLSLLFLFLGESFVDGHDCTLTIKH